MYNSFYILNQYISFICSGWENTLFSAAPLIWRSQESYFATLTLTKPRPNIKVLRYSLIYQPLKQQTGE